MPKGEDVKKNHVDVLVVDVGAVDEEVVSLSYRPQWWTWCSRTRGLDPPSYVHGVQRIHLDRNSVY